MQKNSLNPADWLTDYGDLLYRYALSRVRSESVAEDLVQDTLLAALQGVKNFNHQSAVSSWLVGILKNKLVDYYRKTQRELPLLTDSDFGDDVVAYQFDENGHWQVDLINWQTPEKDFDNQAFWRIFEQCKSRLPETMARLFMMRIDGVSTEECCQILAIGNANQLWVALSRTRMKLRLCLETNWFDKGEV
ncbi:MAG: sigma-70 family RNA polymerase sigma factor [Methylococcales bacterium]|nr:sigma-70 family RNA polymerase sigma factor [Methylococcales bacterium]MDD5753659.1 sigma-70 family RNA polymerase sigma factor [Methylococcales bacterium]